MARLSFSRDGKVMLDYLEAAIDEVRERMESNDDLHCVRLFQGESRTLRGLKKLLTPVSS